MIPTVLALRFSRYARVASLGTHGFAHAGLQAPLSGRSRATLYVHDKRISWTCTVLRFTRRYGNASCDCAIGCRGGALRAESLLARRHPPYGRWRPGPPTARLQTWTPTLSAGLPWSVRPRLGVPWPAQFASRATRRYEIPPPTSRVIVGRPGVADGFPALIQTRRGPSWWCFVDQRCSHIARMSAAIFSTGLCGQSGRTAGELVGTD